MSIVQVKHAFVSSAAEGADATKVRTSNWNAPLTLTYGPAFSVSLSADQTPANATATKILYNTEELDSDAAFASNRFTPQVAGWYQISINQTFFTDIGTSGDTRLSIYKNGAELARLGTLVLTSQPSLLTMSGSRLVQMNGSTDYVEAFGFITSASNRLFVAAVSHFSGYFVRP